MEQIPVPSDRVTALGIVETGLKSQEVGEGRGGGGLF